MQQWVWKTTIKLQEELRDFIVRIYRDKRLYPKDISYWPPQTLKKELRDAAFNSHPKAYVSGGLTIVAILAPELIRDIARIPQREFSPLSPNFKGSVQQVLTAIEKVVGEAAGVALASMAGPAHTRSLQHAHHRDMSAAAEKRQAIDSLNWLKAAIRGRELDAPGTLDEIIRRLNARQFSDMGMAKLAREVVESARARKNALSFIYQMEVNADPPLRFFYDKRLEGWER